MSIITSNISLSPQLKAIWPELESNDIFPSHRFLTKSEFEEFVRSDFSTVIVVAPEEVLEYLLILYINPSERSYIENAWKAHNTSAGNNNN